MASAELGDFLRRRRESLAPAGPSSARRRTPGLRRDEVAALANMSTVYYERIEQGRGPQPSAAVLAGIAGALQLTPDECDHLHLLAGHAAPARRLHGDEVDAGLAYVLTAVEDTTPGFISDDLGELVAQNRLNVELFGRVTGLPGRDANLIWRWFTSPGWRDGLEPREQQEATGLAYVADLRAAVAQRGADHASTALVTDLRTASADFAHMWDRHEVGALHCSAKVVHDPRVGRLDLECSVITSASSRQRLLLLQPAPGTPTRQRLAALSTYS